MSLTPVTKIACEEVTILTSTLLLINTSSSFKSEYKNVEANVELSAVTEMVMGQRLA